MPQFVKDWRVVFHAQALNDRFPSLPLAHSVKCRCGDFQPTASGEMTCFSLDGQVRADIARTPTRMVARAAVGISFLDLPPDVRFPSFCCPSVIDGPTRLTRSLIFTGTP